MADLEEQGAGGGKENEGDGTGMTFAGTDGEGFFGEREMPEGWKESNVT